MPKLRTRDSIIIAASVSLVMAFVVLIPVRPCPSTARLHDQCKKCQGRERQTLWTWVSAP